MNFTDYLRLAIFILFGLCLGEVAWLTRIYLKLAVRTHHLLPTHVVLVGTSTLMLVLQVVIDNIKQFGSPLSWYSPYSLFAIVLLYASVFTIRRLVVSRRNAQSHEKHEDYA